MKIGAAKRAVAFPDGFWPMEGFAKQIDDLHVRVLLLEKERRYALVSLEMTSLPPDEIEALTEVVKGASGARECFICATHTFSAPHLMPDHLLTDDVAGAKKAALQRLLRDAAGSAASDAASNMAEARLSIGTADCGVNSPRDIETAAGWWIDACGVGAVDRRMTVLKAEDASGRIVCILAHYPVQSSVLDGSRLREGGKAVSSDLAGRMCALLEKRLHGGVAMFIMGAAGDQAPRDKAVRCNADSAGRLTVTDKQDDAISLCERLGGEMTEAARLAMDNARPMRGDMLCIRRCEVTVPAKKMERDLSRLHPTRVPPYVSDGETTQTVELFTIGDLRLVCVKPELCCATSLMICEGFPNARVATMVNGGAKYMADAASYDRITYEAMNSPFARGAAEKLAVAARRLLAGEA